MADELIRLAHIATRDDSVAFLPDRHHIYSCVSRTSLFYGPRAIWTERGWWVQVGIMGTTGVV